MLHEFQKYISENNLFEKKDKILLTVSGGQDSVVLFRLFLNSEFNFAVAHYNFKLRGIESDEDEIFVQNLCLTNNIQFFWTSFDTYKYSKENKISIEEAARNLRYDWFESIRKENGFDYIATAHHANDNAETVLMKLIKGTGIKGLQGIKPKNSRIIRPLLFAYKKQITDYIELFNIEYRTDKSNTDSKFTRNKIRNEIIPILEQINPSFIRTMNENIKHFTEIEKIYRNEINNIKNKCLINENNTIKIDISELKNSIISGTVLFEILSFFDFSSSVSKEIFENLDSGSGKKFYSSTHCLLKDRNFLIIEKNEVKPLINIEIQRENIENTYYEGLSFWIIKNNENYQAEKSAKVALLDYDKIKFPLTLRNWKQGDFFYPLGMTGKKLLSDFFIDNKLNIFEKEKILVLADKNKILWVVGMRIDNRLKISSQTKEILIVKQQ